MVLRKNNAYKIQLFKSGGYFKNKIQVPELHANEVAGSNKYIRFSYSTQLSNL